MKIEYPHRLSKVDAIQKFKTISEKMYEDNRSTIQTFEQTWQGSVGRYIIKARGFTFDSKVLITDKMVSLDISLPFSALLFKSTIKESLIKNLRSHF